MSYLENCIRENLDENAPRAMAVLDPIKVTITNLDDNHEEMLNGPVHPKKEEMGRRDIPFNKVVYIDREDFMEEPPKKLNTTKKFSMSNFSMSMKWQQSLF